MTSKQNLKQKDFKQENLSDNNKKEVRMAYFCRVCQLWHYPGSRIFYAHRIYASQRHTPRRRVKRRKKSFWDRF